MYIVSQTTAPYDKYDITLSIHIIFGRERETLFNSQLTTVNFLNGLKTAAELGAFH